MHRWDAYEIGKAEPHVMYDDGSSRLGVLNEMELLQLFAPGGMYP